MGQVAPTERSIPLVRITRCWPIATNGDHRRLSQNIAEIARGQKIGRKQTDDCAKDQEDEDRTHAQSRRPVDTGEKLPSVLPIFGVADWLIRHHGVPLTRNCPLNTKTNQFRLVKLFFMD
jgi:hypothetical protein